MWEGDLGSPPLSPACICTYQHARAFWVHACTYIYCVPMRTLVNAWGFRLALRRFDSYLYFELLRFVCGCLATIPGMKIANAMWTCACEGPPPLSHLRARLWLRGCGRLARGGGGASCLSTPLRVCVCLCVGGWCGCGHLELVRKTIRNGPASLRWGTEMLECLRGSRRREHPNHSLGVKCILIRPASRIFCEQDCAPSLLTVRPVV